jgi:small subunit ribosomal protein S13
MARLLGVEIPNEKKIEYSLPYIFGIGLPLARKILAHTNIDPNIRTGERTLMVKYGITDMHDIVEGDIRFTQSFGVGRK